MGDAASNAEGGGQKPAEQPANGGGDAKGGNTPGPVPYAVFKEANDRIKTLETQIAGHQTELQQFGKLKFDELNSGIAKERQSFATKLELARAGVQSDQYLDYLTGRYTSLPEQGRPAVKDFVTQLKTSEPAFFGASTAGEQNPATNPAKPPPTTSPDATTDATTTKPPAADKPLSDDVIKTMDQAEFNRRWPEIEKWYAARRKQQGR